MTRLTAHPHFPTIFHSIEYYCEGITQVHQVAHDNQKCVNKMHEGLAKVISGQMRILKALNSATARA